MFARHNIVLAARGSATRVSVCWLLLMLVVTAGCHERSTGRAAAHAESTRYFRVPINRRGSGDPSLDISRERDPRALRHAPRTPDKIRTELAALQGATSQLPKPDDEQRIALLWRLADAEAELARAIERDFLEFDVMERNAARARAISTYGIIISSVQHHPTWVAALYYRGLELELDRQPDDAIKDYLQILRKAPTSEYAPLARYGIAENIFRWWTDWPQLARDHFEGLIEKFPQHAIVPFALVRLGELADRRGDKAAADALYAKVERDFRGTAAARLVSYARGRPGRDTCSNSTQRTTDSGAEGLP